MQLVGSRGQQVRDFTYDASGTITSGGTPQLILPERKSTSSLIFENLSSGNLWLGVGSARATCTISGGVVNAVTITNPGFNFTIRPNVYFYGGGNTGWNMTNKTFLGCGQPTYPSPPYPATGLAVMTGSVGSQTVQSITITSGGSAYAIAPFVFLSNSENDPFGCEDPSQNSGTGILLYPGGSWTPNGTTCTTDPISLYGATTGQRYTCKWMP